MAKKILLTRDFAKDRFFFILINCAAVTLFKSELNSLPPDGKLYPIVLGGIMGFGIYAVIVMIFSVLEISICKPIITKLYGYVDDDALRYFALYFPNEKDGGELRSKYFKGAINQKAHSIIEGREKSQLNVFEGFMDFLAALAMKDRIKPQYDSLVLNSTALIKKSLPVMENYQRVNLFLDNDQSGKNTAELIKNSLGNIAKIKDYSGSYKGYKDLSEYHQEEQKRKQGIRMAR